jgi:urease accessory protein
VKIGNKTNDRFPLSKLFSTRCDGDAGRSLSYAARINSPLSCLRPENAVIIVESIVGNVHDESWKSLLNGVTFDHLDLDQWQAQKNRFRGETEQGVELALSLERNTRLRNGDILIWNEPGRQATIARIALQDVLVIDLSQLLDHQESMLAQTCFELGHALGNQHWPAVVKGAKVYVPLTVARQVMASVMKTHAFSGITYEFVPGTEVIPYLLPHEARRLFGGANSTPHSHISSSMLDQ